MENIILKNIIRIISDILKTDIESLKDFSFQDVLFTDIGLDSLNLVVFTEVLSQEYPTVPIKLSLLFNSETNTIKKLSAYISNKLTTHL